MPFDASVWACLLAAFWGLARLGELVMKKGSFNKRYHPSAAQLSWEPTPRAPAGVVTAVLALPWTKTKASGEKLVLAPQNRAPCPVQALQHHLHINQPSPNAHLFAYKHGNKTLALKHSAFTQRIGAALTAANISSTNLKGHSLRIGGCTEFLLRGVPIDTVRLHGRWTSEAWRLYLREHVELLAPHLMDHQPHVAALLVDISHPPPSAGSAPALISTSHHR
ncbi:hypothetical protein CF326_g7368 [Tilletia indica]|nr:hypothetical protein CF326_g7368 [Tilletia indica]